MRSINFKNSILFKIFTIAILGLLLLIPDSMIRQLIYERQNLRDTAIDEVSSKWGSTQTITGPIISVPYNYYTTLPVTQEKELHQGHLHFLPDHLKIEGNVIPKEKNRSIYTVILYNTKLNLKGSFNPLNASEININQKHLQWDKAFLAIGISDMIGVQNTIKSKINHQDIEMQAGTRAFDIINSGVSAHIGSKVDLQSKINFEFNIELNGSSTLRFTPLAKINEVNLNSNWANPSFEGSFLPNENTVSDTGFDAYWKVLDLNRNYPQSGLNKFIGINSLKNKQNKATILRNEKQLGSFGVKFLLPIDEYQKTVRSSKYAGFFILITFLTFFFIEVLNRKRLHPIQYLLIGAAIILFYVLLLSFSEHISFNNAYGLASAIILTLISVYSYFILNNKKLTLLVVMILGILYGFFFSILQLQEYALLLGSIGLLIILATIMWLTRKIDWYNINTQNETQT